MNIHQAQRIPIVHVLEKMNARIIERVGSITWYLSPLRNESNPSFYVNSDKNFWFDTGLRREGDTIALVCAYLEYSNENYRIQDALRWIKNMLGPVREIASVHVPDYSKQDRRFVLRNAKPLENIGLIKYLKSRGIPCSLAFKHLKEVRIYDSESKTTFLTLGLRNESGGYELRHPTFKGNIRRRDITFIRGKIPKHESLNIFDDFMDYLSAIIYRNGIEFDGDSIILNSLLCMKQAVAYIKNYGYTTGYTWLDNDIEGHQATKAFAKYFKLEDNLTHKPMNNLYKGYKDVNDWLCKNKEH